MPIRDRRFEEFEDDDDEEEEMEGKDVAETIQDPCIEHSEESTAAPPSEIADGEVTIVPPLPPQPPEDASAPSHRPNQKYLSSTVYTYTFVKEGSLGLSLVGVRPDGPGVKVGRRNTIDGITRNDRLLAIGDTDVRFWTTHTVMKYMMKHPERPIVFKFQTAMKASRSTASSSSAAAATVTNRRRRRVRRPRSDNNVTDDEGNMVVVTENLDEDFDGQEELDDFDMDAFLRGDGEVANSFGMNDDDDDGKDKDGEINQGQVDDDIFINGQPIDWPIIPI
jgi:hypothetical protein